MYEDDVDDDDDEDDSEVNVSENQSSSYDKRVISPKQTEVMVKEKKDGCAGGDVQLLDRKDSVESTGDTTIETGKDSCCILSFFFF